MYGSELQTFNIFINYYLEIILIIFLSLNARLNNEKKINILA